MPRKRTERTKTHPKTQESPSDVMPKKTKVIEPNDIDNIFENVRNLILSKVHAVCAIPIQGGKYKIRITIDEKAGAQEQQEIVNSIPFVEVKDLEFVKSKQLQFFAPNPVCTKYDEIGGSCGVFFKSKGRLCMLSAAHVMPGKKQKFRIAKLFHMQSDIAQVEFTEPLLDIGVAEIQNPGNVKWTLFPSTIVKAVDNEFVAHFGAASVEESYGFVRSTRCAANIEGIPFLNVINLSIDSRHGDSGAPVVTNKNEVIGLIIGGNGLNGDIYCSDLFAFQQVLKKKYGVDQISLDGTNERPWVRLRRSRRREIELQLHRGRIIKPAVKGEYGEIITDESVSVMTHSIHSFAPQLDPVDPKREVWFFAVPLEYIVTPEEMVGIGNTSPLLAINVSNTRRGLEPLSGLHRRQPCGTGLTI